jgi:hypothetical protein
MIDTAMHMSEVEANALGFTVKRSGHDRWWDLCSKESRPYVGIRYRARGKYATIYGDDLTATRFRRWSDEETQPHGWDEHSDWLRHLMSIAARRAIEAGYRGGVAHGAQSISTCLAVDAAPIATVLIEVWNGNTTGLDRLLRSWEPEECA